MTDAMPPDHTATVNNSTRARAYLGWHLVAFADDLTADVTAVDIGQHRLVAVRTEGRIRVYDATCPHRGAHLGHGGRLQRGCLLCPFHGRRVHLGLEERGTYRVAEHDCVQVGDALFVRLSGGPDHGFRHAIGGLAETHTLISGFKIDIAVEGSIVIENAFDPEHFAPVHGLRGVPDMEPFRGPDGELSVDTELNTPGRATWEGSGGGATIYRFSARAFSPSLVMSQVGPSANAPFFFTGTLPTETGCTARVAVAMPRRPDGRPQSPMYVAGLVAGSMEAFREDIPVWENLAPDFVPSYDERDHAVLAFREFVDGFAQ